MPRRHVMRPKLQQAKGEPLVELSNAKLVITIEADYDLADEGMGDIDTNVERALEHLRELGGANVVSRKILGTVKPPI